MKLNLTCYACEYGAEVRNSETVLVEARDDGLYDVTCARGHRTFVCIHNQKYEVLFELGAMALLDGYTREAVASIAGSLERFYEFYIRVLLLKYDVAAEEVRETWKNVDNQSERQMGAFLFLYLVENKKAPEFFKKKKKVGSRDLPNFRNEVIHKGYIPTQDEVLEYGEHVLAFMSNILIELRATSQAYINQVNMRYEAYGDPSSIVNVGLSLPSAINPLGIFADSGESNPVSFKETLERIGTGDRTFWSKH